MCLAIPMQIIQIAPNGMSAKCQARGIEREAGLMMMEENDIQVGDFVMISLGQVMHKITEAEAEAAWACYDEIFNTRSNDLTHS